MADVPIHVIAEGVRYLPNPHHRNKNPKKSQWIIVVGAEIASFTNTWNEQWLSNAIGWGLHFVGDEARFLGVARDRETNLFIAKFVIDQSIWHGYPADHRKSKDRPPDQILQTWLVNESLPAANIRKVQKGEPCSL